MGGSGVINLLITNLGFGEPVWTFRNGSRFPQVIGGAEPETVNFFFDEADASFDLVGPQTVWAWPFPEVCTVAETLHISGDSNVKMGTAPDIWNVVLGALVALIPRSWWRSYAFSGALANFSQPMVAFADRFLTNGETHAIRVDVTSENGSRVSAIQVCPSFCVFEQQFLLKSKSLSCTIHTSCGSKDCTSRFA